MDDRASARALGAHGRLQPPGFQYWAIPNPRRAPQSLVRDENGTESKRIHSVRLHHFMAKAIDLWDGRGQTQSQQDGSAPVHTTEPLMHQTHSSKHMKWSKNTDQERFTPSRCSPVWMARVLSSRPILMNIRERPSGTLRLRTRPRMNPNETNSIRIYQRCFEMKQYTRSDMLHVT